MSIWVWKGLVSGRREAFPGPSYPHSPEGSLASAHARERSPGPRGELGVSHKPITESLPIKSVLESFQLDLFDFKIGWGVVGLGGSHRPRKKWS